jgi:8-oxo-dGTP diphosphatase
MCRTRPASAAARRARSSSRECVGALVLHNGRILLGRRAPHKTFAGAWDVPGGHVEQHETREQALLRELEEELGITATAWALHSSHENDAVRLYLYIVTQWQGTVRRLGNEHSELRWHDLSTACELYDLAAPEFAEVFRILLQSVQSDSR